MSEPIPTTASVPPPNPPPTRFDTLRTALAAAPLASPAVGIALGILLDAAVAPPLIACAALFIAGGIAMILCRRRPMACAALLLVPACGAGAARHLVEYRRIRADHIVRYSSDTPIGACVTGTLLTEPSLSQPDYGAFNQQAPRPPRTTFLLEAESLDGIGGPIGVSGLVRVTVREPLPGLQAGDRVRAFGRMYRPVPPANPGEPDWPRYQRRRGVLVGLSCEHAAAVPRLASAKPGMLARLRRHCRRLLLDDVGVDGPAEQSVLEAIILGQRSTVDRAINDAFVATGTVHILSVSGSHLAMLGGAVWFLSGLAGRSRRQSAAIVLAALLSYAALAEPNAPVLRSAIMAAMFCTALLLRRPVRTANWLAGSALAVLAVRPMDLFDPGFQLSFVTLGGVLYLSGPVRDLGRRILRPRAEELAELAPPGPPASAVVRAARATARQAGNLLAVAVAAWIAGAPLGLYHFGQISTWGWLNSLLIAPLIAMLMLVGFAKLLLTAIWPSTALLLGPLLALLTEALAAWVRLLARIPGVTAFAPSPPLWLVIAALSMCAVWAARRTFAIPGHATAVGMLACLTAGVFWCFPGRPADGELRIRAAAVGDGTAIFIRFPNGRALVYDVGTIPPYPLYRGTLRPLLGEEGIRRFDAAVISHADLDHFSGLLDLQDHTSIREVWGPPDLLDANGPGQSKPPVRFLLDELARRGIRTRTLTAGDRLSGTGGVDVDVLWPPADEPCDRRDTNESSVVLRLRYRGFSVLLCGDIEEEPQRRLAARPDARADVLVLPHHGSVKPWTDAFVQALSPRYAIRSSGKRGEIASAAVKTLARRNRYFNTADAGSVLIRIGPAGLDVSAYRTPETNRKPT